VHNSVLQCCSRFLCVCYALPSDVINNNNNNNNNNNKAFTRNQRVSCVSEQRKSSLTDHASQDNRVINWPVATILDRKSDKSTERSST